MKQGTSVQALATLPSGVIVRRRINELTDELEALVRYTDANGEQQERWFDVESLAAVQATEGGEA